jgi:hypothetical protein
MPVECKPAISLLIALMLKAQPAGCVNATPNPSAESAAFGITYHLGRT